MFEHLQKLLDAYLEMGVPGYDAMVCQMALVSGVIKAVMPICATEFPCREMNSSICIPVQNR